MANPEHLAILKQGVQVWNEWRERHPEVKPDLVGADLHFAKLIKANLREANLRKAYLLGAYLREANLNKADLRAAILRGARIVNANLSGANLWEANLINADLRGADLHEADLRGADIIKANLRSANLKGALLSFANLREANLNEAELCEAQLVETILIQANLEGANLSGCRIFGISVWKLKGIPKDQSNLNLADWNEPAITVDNLEVAQFIYLLLNNEKIRGVIDTIARKVVLILGRFTPERKAVLDAIREELRKRDYIPVLFDFDKPATRDLTETIRTLAHLSRFIIADITDPSSIPLELQSVVPDLAVPLQPLLLSGKEEFGMFLTLRKYHWVLPTHRYQDLGDLLASLGDRVIGPAEKKAEELERR